MKNTNNQQVLNLLKYPKRYDLQVSLVYGIKLVHYYNDNGWSNSSVPFNNEKIRRNYKKIGIMNNITYYRLKKNL